MEEWNISLFHRILRGMEKLGCVNMRTPSLPHIWSLSPRLLIQIPLGILRKRSLNMVNVSLWLSKLFQSMIQAWPEIQRFMFFLICSMWVLKVVFPNSSFWSQVCLRDAEQHVNMCWSWPRCSSGWVVDCRCGEVCPQLTGLRPRPCECHESTLLSHHGFLLSLPIKAKCLRSNLQGSFSLGEKRLSDQIEAAPQTCLRVLP